LGGCKKNATRMGAHLVFIDESGFLLLPTVRKTWAPRGQTPILRHKTRRDKISAISGISVSPRRQRLNLYFELFPTNIGHVEACLFLGQLLRHLRGRVIAVWDNASIHKGEPIRQMCRRHPRLHLERFPSYAPELNPDEGVWKLAKEELANGRPDSIEDLAVPLLSALERIAGSQALLRSCIHHSDLPFF
jgi:transposase